MFNRFKKKKSDSKESDSKKSDSKESADEDISQNDSENKPDVDEPNSELAPNEEKKSEPHSENNLESSKPPPEDESKQASQSSDGTNSKVSAEDGESTSVEDKNSETATDKNSETVTDENSETVTDKNSETAEDKNSETVEDKNSEAVTDKNSETATDKNSETVTDDNLAKASKSLPLCINCKSSIDQFRSLSVPTPGLGGASITDIRPPEEGTYTFDEAVEITGYGKFQKLLTMLIGLCWFADAFEVLILVIIDDYLGCEWDIYMWQDALLSSNMFIGMTLGGPVYGIVADTMGRRKAIAISMLMAFIFGAFCSISPNIWYLMTLRILVGFSTGSLAQGVTLCVEFYPIQYRGLGGFYINYYWSVGNILLVVLCWTMMEGNHMWRWLIFVVSLPCLGVFISTWWYPESIRYYLVTDQYDKAVEQLRKLAQVNRALLPRGSLKKEVVQETKGSLFDLLRPPHTRTTLLFWYIWFAVAFHYYGIAFMTPLIIQEGKVLLPANTSAAVLGNNATTTGEFFVTKVPCKPLTSTNYFDLMWTGTAEIPGMWFFSIMVQYAQRKSFLGVTCFVNAVLIFFLLVDFHSTIPGKMLLYFLRANSGGIFQLAMTMTSEVFPTTLRATSMGSCHAFSMMGAAIVPFIAQVLIINKPILAVSLMSVVIFVSSVAAFFLPREMKDVAIKDFSYGYKEVERRTPTVIRNIV